MLCVGAPTHAWNASQPVKEFLEHLASITGLKGKKAFAFDTQYGSRLAGSGGAKIEKKLATLGLTIVKPSQSAIVKKREGPLEENAENAFKQTGLELSKLLQAQA